MPLGLSLTCLHRQPTRLKLKRMESLEAPKDVNTGAGDAPETSSASATLSVATIPPGQPTEETRGAVSAASAAASADTHVKTGSASGATYISHLRDASHDWVLMKGSHNIVWPSSSSSFPSASLTTGLNELGKALFDDDQGTPKGQCTPTLASGGSKCCRFICFGCCCCCC